MSNQEIVDRSNQPSQIDIDVESGWVLQARRIRSPNCDARPQEVKPELIVIHNISLPPGQYGGPYIDALFCNQLNPDEHPYFKAIHSLQVSSHLLIRRDGGLAQYVPLHLRAWHAGQSWYEGRACCNDFSMGIELEGQDHEPFEAAQYEMLASLTTALIKSYSTLSADRIVGHSDIAPGRKTDPGPAFEWSRFRQALWERDTR